MPPIRWRLHASSRRASREHDYSVDHHDGRLIILTNSDGAEDYRIVEAPVDAPGREHWREIEPHKPGRLILDVVAYKDFLVRLEREDGLPRIVVRRFADGEEHAIAFAEEAYSLGVSDGYEYDTPTLRFTYSSMTTPAQVFDYDMNTRARELRKTQEIPSGHDPVALRHAPRHGAGEGRRDGAGVAALSQGDQARRLGAPAPLRLRRLRHQHSGRLLHQCAELGRSRLRLRHRPCARRQGQGLSLVQGRQAREEDEHASPTSSRRASSSPNKAIPRAGGSSRMAAAPAAC